MVARKDFQVPLAAAPRLDHLGGHDVHEDLGERPALRDRLQVIRRLVPDERRVEHQRQEEVVAVVDHDQLAERALLRRVIDEVLLGAVRPDVALERELARDDVLDRDLLVPAVAAVALVPRGSETSFAPQSAQRTSAAWFYGKPSGFC